MPGSGGSVGDGVAGFGVATVVIVVGTMPPGANTFGAATLTIALRLSMPNVSPACWNRVGFDTVLLNHAKTIPLNCGVPGSGRRNLAVPEDAPFAKTYTFEPGGHET